MPRLALANRLRRLAALHRIVGVVLGVVHYCLPTLILGSILRMRAPRRVRHRRRDVHVPTSIVVFRLDRIGDLVLCSAMLRELRQLYPSAHITIVVRNGTQALVEHCPYVNEVLTKPVGLRSLASRFGELGTTLAFCRRHLSRRDWDLAIVPRWDMDCYFATLMGCYTAAPRRVGFSERSSSVKRWLNWRFDRFYTDVLPPGVLKHEAERNLDVVRHLGGQIRNKDLELWLTPADEAFAARCLADFGLSDSGPVIAFGIGAGHEKRRWPAFRFAQLIDHLRSSVSFTPAIICEDNEMHIAREVQAHTDAELLLLSHPTLRQSAAFLARCALFIGNDSGPIHIAAAAGIPVVGISCHPVDGDPANDNSPDRFGPFTDRRAIVRPLHAKHPCKKGCTSDQPHCITEVSVTEVATEASSLLESQLTTAS